ncbi:MAG: prolipoprotein diacylglyceryl transferase [Clostridia bacterium]|nr:prolipoprotein diacylglyceryl transferase [Clostridia bacterium]MDD4387051.1 prolipoprotein diacylglyceryl transferase [Clostridia bacterium]
MFDNHYTPENWGILTNIQGISTYTIFVSLAIILGIICYIILSIVDKKIKSENEEGKKLAKEKSKYTLDIVIMALLGGFIGSKIPVIIENLDKILDNVNNLKLFILSGKSIVGGLVGGYIAIRIYKKVNKIEGMRFGNNIAPSTALAMGIGRIGCFLSGCCYGIKTDFCGIDFGDGTRIPTQLYEAVFCIMLFVYLVVKKYKKKDLKDGELFSDLVIYYFAFRFIIEFVRATEKTIMFLSIYQIICLLGIVFMLFKKRKVENND